MNIEQEIWNDFKELGESSVKRRLDWCESVSLGLNKRLEFDEDFRINKFLAGINDFDSIENIDWAELAALYPKRDPIIIPKGIYERYPPAKFRTKHEWKEIRLVILNDWESKKKALYQKIPNEISAKEYLIYKRWGDDVRCPFCGGSKVYSLRNGYTPFKCGDRRCSNKFNARNDTIFENTKLPLLKWYEGIYLLTAVKTRKISTHQLSSVLSITQKTAWFMVEKIKSSINDEVIKNIKLGLF